MNVGRTLAWQLYCRAVEALNASDRKFYGMVAESMK